MKNKIKIIAAAIALVSLTFVGCATKSSDCCGTCGSKSPCCGTCGG